MQYKLICIYLKLLLYLSVEVSFKLKSENRISKYLDDTAGLNSLALEHILKCTSTLEIISLCF